MKNFAGHLQTEGYAACEAITRRPEVTALGCMAHARREFVEANDGDAGRADWMLSQMQQLYQIERQAREANLSHDERYRQRQESARPILIEIKACLDQVEPFAYLKDLLSRIADHPHRRVAELLPQNWKTPSQI
ncbi:MAG: IS66 family transposase [candidate division KSB1 bacterium]|nr:IS66 family transposase [candidate division KSB1 bacterium]MDZ7365440.1 IS66 family transposase [candidate division KSB1 bacterium]MDZ7403513.1 IS66 family transposase [candidate division KSB1 bacterium]